jgi:hypothetical protein
MSCLAVLCHKFYRENDKPPIGSIGRATGFDIGEVCEAARKDELDRECVYERSRNAFEWI